MIPRITLIIERIGDTIDVHATATVDGRTHHSWQRLSEYELRDERRRHMILPSTTAMVVRRLLQVLDGIAPATE